MNNTNENLSNIMIGITQYIENALILLMAFAVLSFVFNVIKYFMRPDADRKEAGNYVLYSVIGFFVIFSFWGIVNILQNTFHLKNVVSPTTQQIFDTILPR